MAGGSEDEVTVAEQFADVARYLAAHQVEATLQRTVQLAADTLHHCEAAGVFAADGRLARTRAVTGTSAEQLDELQRAVDEGPCIESIREHAVVSTGDLAVDARWPRFSARAHAETGMRSALAIRLFVDDDTLGALHLYSTQPNAFVDDVDVALGAVFAAHAALAISASLREQDLERKAASRDLIGRAKGILVARSNITDEAAFDMLRRASQRLNIKLTEVASDVIDRANEAGREGGD